MDSVAEISAHFVRKKLTVGAEHRMEVSMDLAEGWSCTNSGMRSARLQFDVPESIELSGQVLSDFRLLSRNEFVMEPFEREIQPGTTTVKFKLTKSPSEGESIGINIVAYLTQEGSEEHHYFRRRIELPLMAGAESSEADAANTKWGLHDTLLVGDAADDFTLPQFGGTEITLSDYLGEKNVIVTTYRAFW